MQLMKRLCSFISLLFISNIAAVAQSPKVATINIDTLERYDPYFQEVKELINDLKNCYQDSAEILRKNFNKELANLQTCGGYPSDPQELRLYAAELEQMREDLLEMEEEIKNLENIHATSAYQVYISNRKQAFKRFCIKHQIQVLIPSKHLYYFLPSQDMTQDFLRWQRDK